MIENSLSLSPTTIRVKHQLFILIALCSLCERPLVYFLLQQTVIDKYRQIIEIICMCSKRNILCVVSLYK